MELKVGDYVKTENGIAKIINYEKNCNNEVLITDSKIILRGEYLINWININYDLNQIIKSSQNIIDLIEVGDYVNGEKVSLNDNGKIYTFNYKFTKNNKKYIKSICTKEQFERMEYKI